MIHLSTVYVCTKFQSSRPHSSWEKSDEKFQYWKLERKKNEEIKGWISSSSLILVYMIHLPTLHVCTNFQSSRSHSSREKCDEKFQCWKLERKKNEEIKGQISSSSLIPVNMIIGEKEKWRNKGMNKQQQPDSGIHDTSAHCPCVYQVSIF